MKKCIFMVMAAMMMAACANKRADKMAKVTENSRMTECNISVGGLHFTKSLNGAEQQVSDSAGIVTFRAKPHADYFRNPNEREVSKNDAAVLLTEIDNKKPFTYSAKVKSGFTPEGTYNAAVLFVYANDTLWQKLCFEQDERGNHRVVSVRTVGTSDDNNHEVFNKTEYIHFKISSDTQTIGSYYSLDGQTWQMVRLYKNNYGDKVYLGISSQAPQSDECISTFKDLRITTDHVTNFRMGE